MPTLPPILSAAIVLPLASCAAPVGGPPDPSGESEGLAKQRVEEDENVEPQILSPGQFLSGTIDPKDVDEYIVTGWTEPQEVRVSVQRTGWDGSGVIVSDLTYEDPGTDRSAPCDGPGLFGDAYNLRGDETCSLKIGRTRPEGSFAITLQSRKRRTAGNLFGAGSKWTTARYTVRATAGPVPKEEQRCRPQDEIVTDCHYLVDGHEYGLCADQVGCTAVPATDQVWECRGEPPKCQDLHELGRYRDCQDSEEHSECWIEMTSGSTGDWSCEGSAAPCHEFSDAKSCNAQLGCTWH